jgi:hypothetical protein
MDDPADPAAASEAIVESENLSKDVSSSESEAITRAFFLGCFGVLAAIGIGFPLSSKR